MSNQPKITYRSDTTGCEYHMMQHDGSFTIQVINFEAVIIHESANYKYLFPWRKTIDSFFDLVTTHINTRKWG